MPQNRLETERTQRPQCREPCMRQELLALSVLAFLAGCASRPPAPVPAAPMVAAPVAAGVDPDLVKVGYQVKRHDGDVFYCRSESSVGTRFATTTCLTAQQIRERERSVQQSKDFLTLPRTGQCVGAECH